MPLPTVTFTPLVTQVEELHHHGALGETEKEKLMVLMKEQVRPVTVRNGLQRVETFCNGLWTVCDGRSQ